MSVLRRTLLSGLATTVQTNVRRGARVGLVFRGRPPLWSLAWPSPTTPVRCTGRWHVAGIAGGRLHRSNWRSDGTQVDFFTLKGVVEDLLEIVGARDVVFQPVDRQPFVAGTAAEISLASASGRSASIGEIDPKVCRI